MQKARPTINRDNVIAAIAIGATTRPALARLFGVDQRDVRLTAVIHRLKRQHRLTFARNDLHNLSLTGGAR